jgi:hypothetical protein
MIDNDNKWGIKISGYGRVKIKEEKFGNGIEGKGPCTRCHNFSDVVETGIAKHSIVCFADKKSYEIRNGIDPNKPPVDDQII